MVQLDESEMDQVGGGLAPFMIAVLVIGAAWMLGGRAAASNSPEEYRIDWSLDF